MSAPNFDTIYNIRKAVSDACYNICTGSFANVYDYRNTNVKKTPAVTCRYARGKPTGHVYPILDAAGATRRYWYDVYDGSLDIFVETERSINNTSHSVYVAEARKIFQNKSNLNNILQYHEVLDVKHSGHSIITDDGSNNDTSQITFDMKVGVKPDAWPTGSWETSSATTTTTTTTTTPPPPYAALFAAIDASNPTLEYNALRESIAGNYSDGDPVTSATEWVSGTYPATQGNAANQPTFIASANGGHPAFRFDGNDRLVASASEMSQPLMVMVVCSFSVTTGQTRYAYDGNDATKRSLFGYGFPNGFFVFAGTVLGYSAETTDPIVAVSTYNGSSSSLDVNGVNVLSGDAGASSFIPIVIGAKADASNTLTGDIQVGPIIWDTPPTQAQIDAIEAELEALGLVTLS